MGLVFPKKYIKYAKQINDLLDGTLMAKDTTLKSDIDLAINYMKNRKADEYALVLMQALEVATDYHIEHEDRHDERVNAEIVSSIIFVLRQLRGR